MDSKLKSQLFDLTLKGDLTALKEAVQQQPGINLGDCWTDKIIFKHPNYGLRTRSAHGEYFSLLHQAATSGFSGHSIELLKYFIEDHHLDPCIGTDKGENLETPLHLAAGYGDLNTVKYFTEELHIDASITDDSGNAPLYYAADGGRLSIVEYLVEEQNVDVLAKNRNGDIALSIAILRKKHDVVKYFLDECHVDAYDHKNFNGRTAIHIALRPGWGASVDSLKYLIETVKLDPSSAKNEEGETPLEYGIRCHGSHHPAVEYLSQVLKDAECPPEIIQQPTDKTVLQEQEVAFTVSTKWPWKGPLSYQWIKDDQDITPEMQRYQFGDNGALLRINAATVDHEGRYKCIVSNNHGRTESQSALLSVVSTPKITTSPYDQTKTYGDEVSFTLTVLASGTLSYKWHKDSELITPDTHPYCEGATTSTLKIKAVLTEYEGTYSCLVSNEAGSVESDSAQLAVVSPVASLFKPAQDGNTKSDPMKEPPRDLPPLGPPKVEHVGDSEKIITGADEGIKLKLPPQSEKDVSVKIQTFNPTTTENLVELPPDTKFVSPIYEVSTTATKLENAEANIEHYAHLQSHDDESDMKFLHSSDPAPPYNFKTMQGGKFSTESNVGTLSFDSPGRYAVGTSSEKQEVYTLYFIYPVPKLSEKCMYALFSASYNQHAFEEHLLQEMGRRFEQAKFWSKKSNVTLKEGSDGFELVPLDEPEKLGYSLTPLSQQTFKIPIKDLVDYTTIKDTRLCLPPSVLMYVEPCEPYPSKDLTCKLQVTGVSDETVFVLNAEAPKVRSVPTPLPSTVESPQTKLESSDIDYIVKILSPYSGKWRVIGEQLGFKTHELGAIEADPETQSRGVNGFLNAMLFEWSKWPSTTHGVKHTKHATLESLKDALKSPTVNLNAVASNLKDDLEKAKKGLQIPVRKEPKKPLAAKKHQIITDFVPMQNVPDVVIQNSATLLWDLTEIHERGIDGEGIVIAVLDDGIYPWHKAFINSFQKKRIKTANLVPGEEKISVSKCERGAHGTMAVFVAGGEAFSNVPCGVAPKASLLFVRIGEKRDYKVSAVIAALEFLIKHREEGGENSLHVVSMSFGMPYNHDDKDQRVILRLILKLKSLDVICVASAGNYGAYKGGVLFPACSEDVISVGALTTKGHSKDTNAPAGINVFAPGEDIPIPSIKQDDGTIVTSGSSCAAPAIAGLVALVMHYAQKCESDPEDREKYHSLLYIKSKLLGKEMIGNSNAILEPSRFFLHRIKDFEQKKEIERLRAELASSK